MDNQHEEQNLIIRSRSGASVSGVKDVCSFDEQGIILSTCMGTLAFDGEALRITRLDLERGEVDFEGKINGAMYADKRTKGRRGK